MPDISKITLPSGTTYDIKDAVARQTAGGGLQFRGVTTTALSDGASTSSYVVGGETLTAANGDLVVYGSKEFLFSTSDNKWHELGDNSAFKALAYKDSASGKVTPSGTVSQPTFSGTTSNVTITSKKAGPGETANFEVSGLVAGKVQTSVTSIGNFTPAGTVVVTTGATNNKTATVSATTGTATYTPAGSVSAPGFSGTAATIEGSGTFTPAGSISFTNTNTTATVSKAASGTATYTPEGTVTAPTISVATAGSTTTIKNPTSVTVAKTVTAAAPGATAPSNAITYYSVENETLSLYQLGYTTGASITTENVTVKNGDAAYSASAPTFSGTGARLVTGNISVPTSASFSGTAGDISTTASYTPAGTNTAPTFSGTGVRLVTGNIPVPSTYTANFFGTEGSVSVTGQVSGDVDGITMLNPMLITGTVVPTGTVSQPTFSGNEATVTVS